MNRFVSPLFPILSLLKCFIIREGSILNVVAVRSSNTISPTIPPHYLRSLTQSDLLGLFPTYFIRFDVPAAIASDPIPFSLLLLLAI